MFAMQDEVRYDQSGFLLLRLLDMGYMTCFCTLCGDVTSLSAF